MSGNCRESLVVRASQGLCGKVFLRLEGVRVDRR